MERVARIELASSAWKAEVLPLNYTRQLLTSYASPKSTLVYLAVKLQAPPYWWRGVDSNHRSLRVRFTV